MSMFAKEHRLRNQNIELVTNLTSRCKLRKSRCWKFYASAAGSKSDEDGAGALQDGQGSYVNPDSLRKPLQSIIALGPRLNN